MHRPRVADVGNLVTHGRPDGTILPHPSAGSEIASRARIDGYGEDVSSGGYQCSLGSRGKLDILDGGAGILPAGKRLRRIGIDRNLQIGDPIVAQIIGLQATAYLVNYSVVMNVSCSDVPLCFFGELGNRFIDGVIGK